MNKEKMERLYESDTNNDNVQEYQERTK